MALPSAAKEGYKLTKINRRPALFTNIRLNWDAVPTRISCYDTRDSDVLDGNVAEVRAVVVVDH